MLARGARGLGAEPLVTGFIDHWQNSDLEPTIRTSCRHRHRLAVSSSFLDA